MITQEREALRQPDAPCCEDDRRDAAIEGAQGLRSFYLTSAASRPRLSIGLLLDDVACPRFVARIIEDIAASNFARVELVVYHAAGAHAASAPPAAPRVALPKRLLRVLRAPNARRLLLYDLYLRLDRDRTRATPEEDPLALVDCGGMLAGIESLTVQPLVKGFTHRFRPADIGRIRGKNLDVLLRFGFNILRGDILEAARYGVWSFHHDDNDHYRGGPAGFWELYEGNPVSGVMLQVLTEELDAGLVLCKSHFATAPGLSLRRNRYGPYWGSTHFVIRKLCELHRYGWEHVRERAEAPAAYRGRRTTYKRPGNVDMGRFAGRVLWRSALRAARSIARPRRRLAVRVGARPLHETDRDHMEGFAWLECPPGHSYADPFLIARDGATWVFFRDYSEATSRGAIACAEVLPTGTLGPVRPCLDLGHDLAYPMVFESDGEAFMIPGAPVTGAVDLYRAARFPCEWTLETRLHRVAAATTTVCHAAGRWWFFVAVDEPPGHCATLLLFHAASLTGRWVFHPANPIASDVRTARGAGAILEIAVGAPPRPTVGQDTLRAPSPLAGVGAPSRPTVGQDTLRAPSPLVRGRRIRPGRTGDPGRGQGFTLSEMLELTPEAYRDRPLVTTEPSWRTGVAGGSYARSGDIEMIDGWPRTVRPRPALGQGVDQVCVASPE